MQTVHATCLRMESVREQRDQYIIDMYRSGLRIREVAEPTGIPSATVQNALRRHGVKTRTRAEYDREKNIERDAAIGVAYESGLTVKEVAAKFELSLGGVKSVLRRTGVPIRHRPPAPEHGEYGYIKGCRCEICRAGNTARCRR